MVKAEPVLHQAGLQSPGSMSEKDKVWSDLVLYLVNQETDVQAEVNTTCRSALGFWVVSSPGH